MKKKTFIWAMALAASLTACGGNPENAATDTPTASHSEEIKEAKESIEESEETQATAEFEEITVIDNDYCTIKLTGINPDNIWGYTVDAYMENKSPDKTYMFSVETASVNGIECDPFFATEVAAGKKANSEISFPDGSLERSGITDFTDIEISFRVYDSNDWTADNVAEAVTHVYPYGEENSTIFTREPQDSDIVIVDNEYISAIITDFENDNIWGYTANLYLINKTDAEVMFSADECSVNGYMIDPFYATSVSAGKSKFSSMSWSNNALAENKITDITDIEFLFRVYNSDDFSAEDFFNETVTINP